MRRILRILFIILVLGGCVGGSQPVGPSIPSMAEARPPSNLEPNASERQVTKMVLRPGEYDFDRTLLRWSVAFDQPVNISLRLDGVFGTSGGSEECLALAVTPTAVASPDESPWRGYSVAFFRSAFMRSEVRAANRTVPDPVLGPMTSPAGWLPWKHEETFTAGAGERLLVEFGGSRSAFLREGAAGQAYSMELTLEFSAPVAVETLPPARLRCGVTFGRADQSTFHVDGGWVGNVDAQASSRIKDAASSTISMQLRCPTTLQMDARVTLGGQAHDIRFVPTSCEAGSRTIFRLHERTAKAGDLAIEVHSRLDLFVYLTAWILVEAYWPQPAMAIPS